MKPKSCQRPTLLKIAHGLTTKLCTDGVPKLANVVKGIADTTYTQPISACFKALSINSKHKLHYGRVQGTRYLEMKRVPSEQIRVMGKCVTFLSTVLRIVKYYLHSHFLMFLYFLGNWDSNNMDMRYSAKLQPDLLKVLAGYEIDEGYSLPRGRILPDNTLLCRIFPWVDKQLAKLQSHNFSKRVDGDIHYNADHDGSTARNFLEVLVTMRVVVLQDAAAFLLLHPDRAGHYFFRHSVFSSSDFLVSIVVLFFCFSVPVHVLTY